jgi:hypothetical protein
MAAVLLLVAGWSLAQNAVRSEQVTLDAREPKRTLTDAIAGFERVQYLVSVHAGQLLKVDLATSNLANTFDISAPAAAKPFYLGGDSGNSFLFRVPATGEYLIDVYLLRYAARDYQSAQYTLSVTLAE